MTDERGDIPAWKDPPEGTRELLRAAREAPAMTKEEVDRAVKRLQGAVAAQAARRRAARFGAALGAAAALAAGLAIFFRPDLFSRRPVFDHHNAKGGDTPATTATDQTTIGETSEPDLPAPPDAGAPDASTPKRPGKEK